jgi:predicted ester cyclase
MDMTERERRVRSFVDEVWNGRNYEAAADLYAEKYVNVFASGPSARVEPIRRYHEAFPDLHLDIEELIVAGDAVVLRVTFRGTDTWGVRGTGGYGTGRRRVGSHHHALRGGQGRQGMGWSGQARSVYSAGGSG